MFRTQYGAEPLPRKPSPAKLVYIPSVTPGVRLEGWLYEPSAPTPALAPVANGANRKVPLVLLFHGVGSRKDVAGYIRQGLVEVDGEIVAKNAAKLKVREDATPVVDGFEYPPPPLLAIYHKPLGVVSTMRA